MAIRNIRKIGDDVLRKNCRNVDVIDDRIKTLVADMFETVEKHDGAGLAAPQIGVLKRIAVINLDGFKQEIINPEIILKSGEVSDVEGCLSVPGKWGMVTRPEKVVVSYQNLNGETFEVTAEGMLCKCLCHEIDHLDGVLYVDKVTEYIDPEDLK